MKGYVNKCELGGSSRLDGSHEVKKASYIKIVRYYVAKTLSSIVTLFPLLGEGLRERVLLEGRKIRRYEDRPFTENSLPSYPLVLLSSIYQPSPLFSPIGEGARRTAFTLAEVLITLGIIGVVAAMTIPSVIAKYQEAQLKAQFKKTYSTILQAMQYVTIENGGYIDCYYNGGNKQSLCQPFYKQMAEHIKYVKYCPKNSYEEGCIPKYKSYHTGGCYGFNEHGMNDNAFTYVLADGSLLISYDYGQEAIFAVDINGKKGPNDRGKDLFSFVIYKNDTGGYYIGDNITYCMDTSDNKSVYIDDMYK